MCRFTSKPKASSYDATPIDKLCNAALCVVTLNTDGTFVLPLIRFYVPSATPKTPHLTMTLHPRANSAACITPRPARTVEEKSTNCPHPCVSGNVHPPSSIPSKPRPTPKPSQRLKNQGSNTFNLLSATSHSLLLTNPPPPFLTHSTPHTTSLPDPRIHTLEEENALLRRKLGATQKRTATREQRVEQLLTQMGLLTSSRVSSAPQTPLPAMATNTHDPSHTTLDTGRLERLIHDTSNHISTRFGGLERRFEDIEHTTLKALKNRSTATQADTPTTRPTLSYPTMTLSTFQETTPQISRSHNIKDTTWSPLKETLGSDYYINELQIPHRKNSQQRIGTARLTNLEKFRENSPTDPIDNLEECKTQLFTEAAKHTKELPLTQDNPAI
ncbi:hypothetical protein HPB47_003811, partial [Ixodes persulcatus]